MSLRVCRPRRSPEAGLTLTELLVSIAVGLMLLAALGYLVVNARQSYRLQDELARVQENGRYALWELGRSIRSAGGLGCANPSSPAFVVHARMPADFTAAEYVRGYEAATPAGLTGLSGRDSLVVLRPVATPLKVNTVAGMQIELNTNTASNTRMYVVTDCQKSSLVCDCNRATKSVIELNCACNSAANLPSYATGAQAVPVELVAFYIRNNTAGNPGLYRAAWDPVDNAWETSSTAGTGEIVENVEDLQLTYAERAQAGGMTSYIGTQGIGLAGSRYAMAREIGTAAGSFRDVQSVRVHLLLRGADENVLPASQSIYWDPADDGAAATMTVATDRRVRQVFVSNFAVRNRLH